MEKMPLAMLITKLAEADKNTSVEFLVVTTPKMNKTGKNEKDEKYDNPYLDKKVTKESLITGVIKFNYASEVNKQRLNEEKDADFVAKGRTWGEKSGCFVSHNGELYIDTLVKSQGNSSYKIDGESVDKKILVPFLPKSSGSKSQELEDKIIINTVKLSGIKTIKLDEITYSIC